MAARGIVALVVVGVLGALSQGCVGDLQPHKQVKELRVLGMRMDPVDARPGEAVSATALIVDPTGADWTATWYACQVPIDTGQYFSGGYDPSVPFCDDPGSPLGLEVGTGAEANFTVPASFLGDAAALLEDSGLAGDEAGGDKAAEEDTAADKAAADDTAADDTAADDREKPASIDDLVFFIGWHMRVVLVVERDDGSARVEAHRRLLVSGLGGQHTNPDPPAIHMQLDQASREETGTTVTEPPATADLPADGECLVSVSEEFAFEEGKAYLLFPLNLPEEPEEYLHLSSSGEVELQEEDYFFSWFTTSRAVSEGMTVGGDPHVQFRVETPVEEDLLEDEDGTPYLPLWVVVRDGRGGTAWCEQRVPYLATGEDAAGSD